MPFPDVERDLKAGLCLLKDQGLGSLSMNFYQGINYRAVNGFGTDTATTTINCTYSGCGFITLGSTA